MQVIELVAVEPKDFCEGVEHGSGHPEAPLFHAGVVLNADRGQFSDFFAAETRNPTMLRTLGKSNHIGRQFRSPGPEESA